MDFQTTLSDQELQEFKEAFSILDKSGKGRISISELRDFIRSLGQIDPTEDEVQTLIAKVDIEKKGSIDFPQFLKLMEMNAMDADKEVSKAFQLFESQDKSISVDQMQNVLQRLGENLSKEEIQDMINEIEQNNSGVLSFDGFRKMMQSGIKK
mmetsp:Transcript_59918/g.95216  ORF Transcript_59918/g.95216 Transcript_59918/m.95216 type:complete len:153 (-) Transcript_59918:19-477(-)